MQHFFAFGKTVLLSLPARATALMQHFFAFGKTVLLSLPALAKPPLLIACACGRPVRPVARKRAPTAGRCERLL
jgi:hypothetical protein